MRLSLDDGYTLDAVTLASTDRATGLPVVTYRYRPALPDALAGWRYDLDRANSGKAQVDATVKFLCAHLVSWDVMNRFGQEAAITPDVLRKVPEPILDQFIKAVTTWAPQAESAAGNSAAG